MRLAEATRVSSRHRTAPMRARPSRTPRRPDRPSPTVRHVWLAALGLLVAGPRQARQWLQVAPEAAQALPDEANSHYRLAFALGRYSQGLSIAKALKLGIAGKVRSALDRTLALAPKHAEAHTALALYHAEIVAKVGSLLAGLTYGAKASEAERHIQAALKLTPQAPIVHVEHANLLLLLDPDDNEDAAAAAYERAAQCPPRDAMEALDAAWAREQIE